MATLPLFELYSDSRSHGYQGPSRYVHYPRAVSPGGGCIAKSEDGIRFAVAGKESLRILRVSDGSLSASPEYRSFLGKGGHRIEATHNLWEGSELKVKSATTGVAWGRGQFSNKIFTSARNGELIMWDISGAGPAKLERRTKDHLCPINQLAISDSVHHCSITGSADGDLRIWDLRDMSKSLMRVHHPASVCSVAFSPSLWQPLQAIVGLDNGSIYRWDLKMGQRGLLDRLLVAHTTPITSIAWREPPGTSGSETGVNGMGWFASGGLDRCVKIWDLSASSSDSHILAKPTYTLHPRYPVRHVLWRPGYECEIAVISNPELAPPAAKTDVSKLVTTPPFLSPSASSNTLDALSTITDTDLLRYASVPVVDDTIEIWDVRRAWVAKWSIRGSGAEGNLTDVDFCDSHAIWALQSSGTFSQFDLRDASKPIASLPRVALTWEVSGSVTFVSDRRHRHEVPYDDVRPESKPSAERLRMEMKTLGDPQTQPQSQNIATQISLHTAVDLESFKQLAKKYVLTGESRKFICLQNAQAAAEVGKQDTAQLWLLLAACLEDDLSPSPPTLPQVTSAQEPFAHPVPAPTSAPQAQSYFSLAAGRPVEGSPPHKTSAARGSVGSTESPKHPPKRNSSRSTSRHLITPASSASSSTRRGLVRLSPITPRRGSFLGQRPDVDRSSSGRRPSTYRRPSVVGASTSPAADKDSKAPSTTNLHLVGAGALDDSDSSSGKESDVDSAGIAGHWSDEEENSRPALMTPTFLSQQRITASSPLSRVLARHKKADEDGDLNDDGETSAFPQSTDSDSDGPIASLRRQSGGRKVSGRHKSRSRSSTVATLAGLTLAPMLSRQDSVSSIRTAVDEDGVTLKTEETILNLASRAPEMAPAAAAEYVQPDVAPNLEQFTERKIELVRAEEKRFKDIGWKALRYALETLAEQGDVQTCAMLVIIARAGLKISLKRSVVFVDAYIDVLDRCRIFPCSAYIRKHCQLSDIQDSTMVHTLAWLLSILNVIQLGSSSIPSVHTATTVDLLCKLLSEKDYVSIAGQLKHASDAKNLLHLMLHVLHERCLSSPDATIDLNQRARRLMIKIVSKIPVIPSSLFVTGVRMPANREYIGSGGFGQILKGELRGDAVALKVLYKTDNDVAFCREALMWRSLDHNLVLPFLGIHEDESASQLFLVSPYMKNGTLAQWRKKANPSIVDIEERMLELAHGIEYIHSEGVVHGDLRGANILLDDELHVQIADFGLTRHTEATNTQSGAVHLNFAAPELFGFSENGDDFSNDTPARTQMSDVYAFGCVYYEIHYDSMPFVGKPDTQIWTLIFRGILPPRLDEPFLGDGAWNMIQCCWERKPSERPKMKDVKERMMAIYQSAFTPTNATNFYYEMLRKLSPPTSLNI